MENLKKVFEIRNYDRTMNFIEQNPEVIGLLFEMDIMIKSCFRSKYKTVLRELSYDSEPELIVIVASDMTVEDTMRCMDEFDNRYRNSNIFSNYNIHVNTEYV